MNWFRSLLGRDSIHRANRKRTSSLPRSRPALECLETRCLLATGITELPPLPTPTSQPNAVTTGPDGNIWFTESGPQANRIGRISTGGTLIGETPLANNSQPAAITVGPDGNLWFTEQKANKIGRVNVAGTLLGETTISTVDSQPQGITVGPDGKLWFVESSGNKIGRIATDGTIVSEAVIPTPNSLPVGITAGPDGNLWFTEAGSNRIAQITPAGVITEFSLPTANSFPFGITTGPDGNLWFTEPNVQKIGRITTGGAITGEFAVPTPTAQPVGIVTGPDGNLWFTEEMGSRIGQITPSGFVAAEFVVPTVNTAPLGIAVGPHSSLVFTEFAAVGNRIAMIHDVLDGNHSFIQALYQDALGRVGAPAELDAWVAVMVGAGTGPVVNGIEHSPEARAHLLRSWYMRFLGRTTLPSDSEIQPFVNALQSGATEEQILSAIVMSDEFFNYANNRLISTGTPNERFVKALYLLLLNRTPVDAEVQAWVGQLTALGRLGIANVFLSSAEYRADVIRGYYSTLLHRSPPSPTQDEVNGWVVSGLDLQRVRIGFEVSLEFFLKG